MEATEDHLQVSAVCTLLTKPVYCFGILHAFQLMKRKRNTSMMTYDFRCLDCNRTFTAQQSLKDHEEHKDPQCAYCGSDHVEHVISQVNVRTSKKS